MDLNSGFKSGVVGIIGKPNVGKSTLLNRLVGEFISIITPKPQTTRIPILGIKTTENYQIAFYDTPGMLSKTKYELHRAMIKAIEEIIEGSDVVCMMVEPEEEGEIEKKLIELIKKYNKKAILIINKVDRVKKENLLPIIEHYYKKGVFSAIIPISASLGDGVEEVEKEIVKILPEGEKLYPEEMVSDRPERFFVAEIIREKIFELYGEEIPYSTAVEIEEWREEEKLIYIHAIIYVERESQRRIIIGKKGAGIKKIGTLARRDIETRLGKKVYLELWVKEKEGWRKDKNFLKRIGYIS